MFVKICCLMLMVTGCRCLYLCVLHLTIYKVRLSAWAFSEVLQCEKEICEKRTNLRWETDDERLAKDSGADWRGKSTPQRETCAIKESGLSGLYMGNKEVREDTAKWKREIVHELWCLTAALMHPLMFIICMFSKLMWSSCLHSLGLFK